MEEFLEIGFIPKSFRLKNNIPGNSRINQNRLKNVSVQAISDEKESHANKLKVVKTEFEQSKKNLAKVFSESDVKKEEFCINKHLQKVRNDKKRIKEKKLGRDTAENNGDVNSDRVEEIVAEEVDVQPRVRRRRKFKRKYLQPQPKRNRRKRSKPNQLEPPEIIPEGWNGVVKNFSDEEVTEVEKMLFSKGKKFCPVEVDPPIVRLQRELNRFYRTLRL